jgi:hypothetical protein
LSAHQLIDAREGEGTGKTTEQAGIR